MPNIIHFLCNVEKLISTLDWRTVMIFCLSYNIPDTSLELHVGN